MHIVISKILEMLIPIDPRTDTTRFKNLFASGSRGRFAPWAPSLRKDPRPPRRFSVFISVFMLPTENAAGDGNDVDELIVHIFFPARTPLDDFLQSLAAF